MKKILSGICVVVLMAVMLIGCTNENQQSTVTPFVTPDFDATREVTADAPETADEDTSAFTDNPAFEEAEMAEEEIATVIAEEAVSSSQSASNLTGMTDTYSEDGELTVEEIEDLEVLYLESLEEVEYLLHLTSVYSYYYGDLAGETLDLLIAMEDELLVVVQLAEEYSDELYNVLFVIENGGQTTEEMLATLEETSEDWYEKMDALEEDAGSWKTSLIAELQVRVDEWPLMEVTELATTRAEAMQQFREYVKGIKIGLTDGVITSDELEYLKQLAVNTTASMEKYGEENAEGMVNRIEKMTDMLVTGQYPDLDIAIEEIVNSFLD